MSLKDSTVYSSECAYKDKTYSPSNIIESIPIIFANKKNHQRFAEHLKQSVKTKWDGKDKDFPQISLCTALTKDTAITHAMSSSSTLSNEESEGSTGEACVETMYARSEHLENSSSYTESYDSVVSNIIRLLTISNDEDEDEIEDDEDKRESSLAIKRANPIYDSDSESELEPKTNETSTLVKIP